jgi:hypothetical protein
MNLEVSFDYKKILRTTLLFLSQYRILISSLILLLVGMFVLQRINTLTATELDESYRLEKLAEINRVVFDQESIDEIVKLNNSSVEITSNFTDRNNPFVSQ